MLSSQPLRWGVLGTGRILQKFGEAFRQARGATLVAIAGRELERARATAVQWGAARAHGSYESLLNDPDVDIVLNALHNGLHCEWTMRALEAGKHVLCEKPLACSCAEVEKMFAAAHANHRWLMEGFMYRFHPQIAEAKRRIATGELGRIVYLHARYTAHGRERENPRFWRDAGGGALMDVGCYCVNALRFFAGSEPQSVSARAHWDDASGVDMMMTGSLEFAENLSGHFVCSFEGEGTFGLDIVGTDGRIFIPDPWLPRIWPSSFTLTRGGKTENIVATDPSAPQHFLAPFALEIEHFSDCVRHNRAPSVVPETDSLANMRVIEELFALSRQFGSGRLR